MLERAEIRIGAVRVERDGRLFLVVASIENPTSRTLYAYGSARRVAYDNATRRLEVQLHDHGVGSSAARLIGARLAQPRVVPLPSRSSIEMSIALPASMCRARAGAPRVGGDLFEELRAFEATEIELEIAHQDVPLAVDPSRGSLDQLQAWGRVIAKTTARVGVLGT